VHARLLLLLLRLRLLLPLLLLLLVLPLLACCGLLAAPAAATRSLARSHA
jgi:hypothetical protein